MPARTRTSASREPISMPVEAQDGRNAKPRKPAKMTEEELEALLSEQEDDDDESDDDDHSLDSREEEASEESDDEYIEVQGSVDSEDEAEAPSAPIPQSSESSASSATVAPASASYSASTSGTNRLDPSLFKSYFASSSSASPALKSALKPSKPIQPPTEEELAAERRARKQARREAERRKARKGGIVVGRDGLPMKRLKDRRTVVRSLGSSDAPSGSGQEQVQQRSAVLEGLPAEIRIPTQINARELDEADQLARSRSNRYVKQKLGLKSSGNLGPSSSSSPASSSATKKKKKMDNADDPLGLGDPAFLPGGEFAHLNDLIGKKKRRRGGSGGGGGGAGKRQKKEDRRGDALRVAGLPRQSRGAPALAFARSSLGGR